MIAGFLLLVVANYIVVTGKGPDAAKKELPRSSKRLYLLQRQIFLSEGKHHGTIRHP